MRRVGGGFTEPPRNFGAGEKAITYHLTTSPITNAPSPPYISAFYPPKHIPVQKNLLL
jgi:hypothetical protein